MIVYRSFQQMLKGTWQWFVAQNTVASFALLPAHKLCTSECVGMQAEAQATFAATSGLCQEVCNKLGTGWNITGQLGVISS